MKTEPFSMEPEKKSSFIFKKLTGLTQHHIEHCSFYNSYLTAFGFDLSQVKEIEEIPFIPARFFKEFSLSSTKKAVAIAHSSGTTNSLSNINLSHKTMLAQSTALNAIVKSFLGSKKRPMLILDQENFLENRMSFDARGAAIMGFKNFGQPCYFALNNSGDISSETVKLFYDNMVKSGDGLIFGFTSKVWKFLDNLEISLNNRRGQSLVLVHGGGWKKLSSLNITDDEFIKRTKDVLGVSSVHNYYGMIEQTGSIFFECSHGKMHSSCFSEILSRNVETLEPLSPGQEGVLQVFSTLPESYPGHSILTEDVGFVTKDQLCECGRFGSSVKIVGRLPEAEIRGCSDTYS